jgi:hypothetical protein
MRRFVSDIFINLVVLVIILIVFFYGSEKLPTNFVVGFEVNKAQMLSKHVLLSDNDTIRLGDSVGKNINDVEGYSNNSLNLACNQAISILGHTLILKQCLLNNSKVKNLTIEGFFRPSSVFNNLNQQWSNNYFIKKFYNSDWFFSKDLITSKQTTHVLDSIFLSKYRPFSTLNKLTWFNNKSIFGHPAFGFNKFSPQNSSLVHHLISTELGQLVMRIKFRRIPVHPEKYNEEMKYYAMLTNLGFDIEKPTRVKANYFEMDKIHLKSEFRNFHSYLKMMDEATTNFP